MKRRGEMFSIDVLALALLTCLLASVVGMLVMGEDGKSLKHRKQLHEQTVVISTEMQESQALLREVAKRIDLSRIERERRIMQTEAEELRRKVEARRKIVEAEKEMARLRDEIAKLERERELTPGRHQIVGNYRGSYILIECVKSKAIVYPGKTSLPKKPDKKTLQQLVDRITEAGFVVFVVRPEGWFGDSFDSLSSMVYPLLEEFEKTSDKKIGRCKFPIESKEPIDIYLPPDPAAVAPAAPAPAPQPVSGTITPPSSGS